MKISAVHPELSLLDDSVPEIEVTTEQYMFQRDPKAVSYVLTYTYSVDLSPEDFKRVVNAE